MLAGDLLTIKQVASNETYEIECKMCSRSTITWEARLEIESLSKRERADLASWVAEQFVRGHKPPTICSSSYEGTDKSQDYRVSHILETLVPRDISERLDRMLENLGARTGEPGERCSVDKYDVYFCYALSSQQMDFQLHALCDEGWVRSSADGRSTIKLTFEGWKRVGELQSTGARSDQAFVAMWFSDELLPAWDEGLYAGIKAAGYLPIRVDKEEHNEKICDRIISEIRRSGLLVADVTGHRQGVYFEAGYAMGLGIPVIWTCGEPPDK
jgi:hypothetical protein